MGRFFGLNIKAWIEQDEADAAFAVLTRFLRGARGTLRIDAANATPWAWSAAGWDGEMIVSLDNPAKNPKNLDLGRYITAPWTGIAETPLSFVRWV